jgi:hypothetical protein
MKLLAIWDVLVGAQQVATHIPQTALDSSLQGVLILGQQPCCYQAGIFGDCCTGLAGSEGSCY